MTGPISPPDEQPRPSPPPSLGPRAAAALVAFSSAAVLVVEITALRDETLITGMAPTIAAASLALCRAQGFEPRFAPPASDIVMASLQASLGQGVALVPSSMANVHFPGITYRPLTPAATIEIYCYYLRNEDSPLLHAMLKTVRYFARRDAN